MIGKQAALALALTSFTSTGFPASASADNMIERCSTEIESHCATVATGRGRVTACLYAHESSLSNSCRAEVVRVAAGSANLQEKAVSAGDTDQTAFVRSACAADIGRFCVNIGPGETRMLACLYARQNAVSRSCSSAMDSVLSLLF